MKYLSCFTGIGGLEATEPPYAVCEIDINCQSVLKRKYKKSKLITDVKLIDGFSVDTIVGGWPCQDLSVAGRKRGLTGENSGLFYEFVNAAVRTNARTLIAENVTNLIRLDNGKVFLEVLRELNSKGFKYISWRVLNARQFGLPHSRNRIFIIASDEIDNCYSIFRSPPALNIKEPDFQADGFYWTAGTQSINYSKGYVPTIKVGSSLAIASPPAVFYNNLVRQLTTSEALKLQGFKEKDFVGIKDNIVYKMAGNAVAVPVGRFVVDGVAKKKRPKNVEFDLLQDGLFDNDSDSTQFIPNSGFYDGQIHSIKVVGNPILASNLGAYLDPEEKSQLSPRAATGLLKRLNLSGQSCPENLKKILIKIGSTNAKS
jgi:DNA (cytosine-5)-methyltransferase 1